MSLALEGMSSNDLSSAKQHPIELLAPVARVIASTYMGTLSALLTRQKELNTQPDKIMAQGEVERSLQVNLFNLIDMLETIKTVFGDSSGTKNHALIRDYTFILERYEAMARSLREAMNYNASMASLEESRLGIQQNRSVKRLTKLAFIFIPLSFVTSVFGMNVDVLSVDGARWWTTIIGAGIVYCPIVVSLIVIALKQTAKDYPMTAGGESHILPWYHILNIRALLKD
jgi:Mg2+ and Co2+ transporter CorA